MSVKPETLAKRAVFQYRRRDILAYASLRLYLRNQCALRDRWSRIVATGLELDQDQPSYNHILQFKEIDAENCIEFRDLYVPGPNEILAEVALLAKCSENAGGFELPSGVYSYRLASGADTQGVFQYYFHGFRERHRAIAQACREQDRAVVLYTDIRRFYPSVTIEKAREVWNTACESNRFPDKYSRLGLKLLENYEQVSGRASSLLIGPMFSHLIGNLVLREIDIRMQEDAPGQYFRYVDDFVIVAPKDRAAELEERTAGMLAEMGLSLHPNKRICVTSERWLEFERAIEDEDTHPSWKTFIGGLKQLLLFHPESRKELEDKFREADIRILPIDFSKVVQDTKFLKTIRLLTKSSRHRTRMKNVSPDHVVSEGLQLREKYVRQLDEIVVQLQADDHFGRKMRVPRLRFLLSRLGYLGTTEELQWISDAIEGVAEVEIFRVIYKALVQRDVSDLLRFGPKAAQMVAQPLRVCSEPVRCSIASVKKEVSQAYAILQLNGVPLEVTDNPPVDDMTTFCKGGLELAKLSESSDMYFRELACLHGSDDPELLRSCLDTAFDRDEHMVFDLLDYMYMAY